jgi:hypothetical protein
VERTPLARGSKWVLPNTDYEQHDNLSLLCSRPTRDNNGCETPSLKSLQYLEDLLIILLTPGDQNDDLWAELVKTDEGQDIAGQIS